MVKERGSSCDFSGPSFRNDTNSFNTDRKSTRLNSSHANISYAVFCLKKKNKRESNGVGPCAVHFGHVLEVHAVNASHQFWRYANFFFFLMMRRPPIFPLFPYPTLFR